MSNCAVPYYSKNEPFSTEEALLELENPVQEKINVYPPYQPQGGAVFLYGVRDNTEYKVIIIIEMDMNHLSWNLIGQNPLGHYPHLWN